MSNMLRRFCATLVALCTIFALLSGCRGDTAASTPSDVNRPDSPQVTPETPEPDPPAPPAADDPAPPASDIEWAEYISDYDEPFLPKDIFTPELYHSGIVPVKDGDKYRIEIRGESSEYKTIVLKGEFGKCYEIKFANKTDGLRMAKINGDPCALSVGDSIAYTSDKSVRYNSGTPSDGAFDNYMYVKGEDDLKLILKSE